MIGRRRPTRRTHRLRARGGLALVVFGLAAGVITQGGICDTIGNPAAWGMADPCIQGTPNYSPTLCGGQGRTQSQPDGPWNNYGSTPSEPPAVPTAAPTLTTVATPEAALSVDSSPAPSAAPARTATPAATPSPSVDLTSPAPSVDVLASYAGTYAGKTTTKDAVGTTIWTLKFTVDEKGGLTGTLRQVLKRTSPIWQWDYAVTGTVDASGRVNAIGTFDSKKDLSKADDGGAADGVDQGVVGPISDGVFTWDGLGLVAKRQ
jgi:hypothetical protein